MAKIVFRGKTYYSVYEMPPNVRRAYEKEQEKASADNTEGKPEPVTRPIPPTIEPESASGMRGLMWGILAAFVLAGIAYLLSRFIP